MKNKSKVLKNIVNVIILFLCAEVLQNFLIGIPELSKFDFRLIFILIVSGYFGMKYGIASAVLVSISYFVQEFRQGFELDVLFLNTNNWIPLVSYVLFSIIIGLKTDKDNLKISNLSKEIEQKNNKEVENNEKVTKYEKEIKELNQILMVHDNSYIQVSKLIKEIEENRNELAKINRILRKNLKNSSCELIKLEELKEKTNQLIDDKKIREMEKNKIWINKKLEKDLPFYMVPVYISQSEKMVLVLWKCEFEQMNVEYKNQIIGISEIVKYIFVNVRKAENVVV